MKLKKKIKYYLKVFKSKLIPYKYDSNRYKNTFLSNENKSIIPINKKIPHVIYCFWTGNNEMSENRNRAFEELKSKTESKVILITPKNLATYILPDYPLHKSFEYLSLVHKSDYLRCYFMHHYGGGYSDIKAHNHSWENAFKKIDENLNDYILGYREIAKNAVAQVEGIVGKDLEKNFIYLLGNCSYIMRAYSPFTTDWYTELHKRLDVFYEDLKKNPGNVMGDNEGYPIAWTEILGNIFHPLCLKYNEHTIYSNSIKPNFKDYR